MDGAMFIGTWWSLAPPLLAIILALVTKEVYSSLFIGVAFGALLYTGFQTWNALEAYFDSMKSIMNLKIEIVDVLLGMIIVLMAKSGGSAAYGKWAGTKIKSKRSAMLATTGLGVLIFVDDYFNCLTVGSVMRPVTDRCKVSRAKLAYIIDATSALSHRFPVGLRRSIPMYRRMQALRVSSYFYESFLIICMLCLRWQWYCIS